MTIESSKKNFVTATVVCVIDMHYNLARERERLFRIFYEKVLRDGRAVGANVDSVQTDIDDLIRREGRFAILPDAREADRLDDEWTELNKRIMGMLVYAQPDLAWRGLEQQMTEIMDYSDLMRRCWISERETMRLAIRSGMMMLNDDDVDKASKLADGVIDKMESVAKAMINPFPALSTS